MLRPLPEMENRSAVRETIMGNSRKLTHLDSSYVLLHVFAIQLSSFDVGGTILCGELVDVRDAT
jgi:hypothetical protein